MNRRQFAVALPAACLLAGCKQEQPVPATPLKVNDPRVQDAISNLASAIEDMEGNVDGLRHGDWSKFVPRVETTASDIRIAYEHLRQAMGMPTA